MKKVIFLTAVTALVVMLAFPAILFAEEGDANSTIGVREQENQAGQYILGDKDADTDQPNDTINDNSTAEVNNSSEDGSTGDGDTEVYCIDGDTAWDTGRDEYTLTDIDVSDELLGESAPLDDDDEDGTSFKNDGSIGSVDEFQEDGVIDPVEAEAIEILSKEATGATSVEDQESVWLETGDNIHNRGNAANKTAITEAAEALATEFLDLAVNQDSDLDNDITLDEFLAEKEINEIDVIVEQDSTIFDESNPNPGTAIATMENPLVPGITDNGKDVYWYILGGAFNMSFSPDELVTETSSAIPAAGTNPTEMNDEVDTAADFDGDGEGVGDHYGIATIDYYYFHWGLDEYPEGTMGINLYAWVDVDEDGLFDIVDVDPEKAADGEDPDGDVVGDFQENHQIVQTEDDGNGTHQVKTDIDGNVETEPFDTKQMDIHKIEGGKVVLGHDDLTAEEEEDPLTILPGSDEQSDRDVTKQRFSTIAYNEPHNDDPIYYGTIAIKINEAEEGLEGAVFGIYNNANTSGDPIETVNSDEEGIITTDGLVWEGNGNTYYMKELSAPAGYNKINTVFEIFISGHGLTVSNGEEEGIIPFIVTNKKTPPEDPEDPEDPEEPEEPEEPDTPEEEIEVEGLTELPFTGMSTVYPIAGISTLLSGLGLFIWSLVARMINRKRNWKHILKDKK